MDRERIEPQFSAAVLAAGRSTRMGTDKAFLRFGNDLLLERQLRCLRESGATELLISGRAEVDYSRFAAKVVRDEFPLAGPLAGVAAALKASSSHLVFMLAVDMPRMVPAMICKILSRCNNAVGCVPFNDHGFEPLGAAYPTSLLPVAEHLLSIGRYSMQEFVCQAVSQGFIQTMQLKLAEHIYFANMNLPHEWAELTS
jgi:molybdopterin-guanine dinucleotide biosynthesis protein A